jgi:hypothetical protein
VAAGFFRFIRRFPRFTRHFSRFHLFFRPLGLTVIVPLPKK